MNSIIEPEIIINSNTREIIVPKELYNIGVVSDNNAEQVKIKILRYFDGNDLSTKDCTISYNNACNERGVYSATKLIEDNYLVIYWNIENFVTKKAGKIKFIVEFKQLIDERGKPYSWSTTSAELNVLPGLDDNISIPEKDISLYMTLLNQITNLDHRISTLSVDMDIINDFKFQIDTLKSQISELKGLSDLSVYAK